MTNEQLAIIVTAFGAVASGAGGLVWKMFTRWSDDRIAERQEQAKEREATTNATLKVAEAMTTMALKFESFEKQLDSVEDAVEEVADEVTGRHEVPIDPPQPERRTQPMRAQTSPLGTATGYRPPKRPRQDS